MSGVVHEIVVWNNKGKLTKRISKYFTDKFRGLKIKKYQVPFMLMHNAFLYHEGRFNRFITTNNVQGCVSIVFPKPKLAKKFYREIKELTGIKRIDTKKFWEDCKK